MITKSRGYFTQLVIVESLFWIWTIPSSIFWRLSREHDVMIPYLPRGIWFLPGEMWRFSPVVFIILSAGIPAILVVLARRSDRRITGPLRYSAVFVLSLVVIVHLVWGTALLRGIP